MIVIFKQLICLSEKWRIECFLVVCVVGLAVFPRHHRQFQNNFKKIIAFLIGKSYLEELNC